LPAAIAPWVTPYRYDEQDLDYRLNPPSLSHLLGTDDLGQDVFSRVIYGGRVTLLIGLTVVLASGTFGLAIGALAGYLSGPVDEALMRSTEIVMAFPSIILAMAIVVGLGPGISHAALAMILVWWPPYARMTRGQVLAVKEMEFVEASVAIGQVFLKILLKEILPNIIPTLIVLATLDVGSAIITASGLSFLGLGAVPPTPEWGAMVSAGRELPTAWWVATSPGLAILFSVLGFNFLGDGIRDLIDPRQRSRQ
jgi:peptide/nickel transport system permease protein